jgi:hypothetical protein
MDPVGANEAPPFNRNAVLRRTPEQIDDDAREQRLAATRLGPMVTESPAMAHYRAARGSESRMYRTGRQDDERLAEAWFWQGKFRIAGHLTTNVTKAREYLEFASAIDHLDHPTCFCSPIQMPDGRSAKGVSVPAKREIQRVFVESLGKEVKFIKCERCKMLFAQTA